MNTKKSRGDWFRSVLTCGFAVFDGRVEIIEVLLISWENLVSRGARVPLPKITPASIGQWVNNVLTSAYEAEGDMMPCAMHTQGKTEEDGSSSVFMGWLGTATRDRFYRFWLKFSSTGKVEEVVVEWDSATGSPSTYLGIEKDLALAGLRDFGPMVSKTKPYPYVVDVPPPAAEASSEPEPVEEGEVLPCLDETFAEDDSANYEKR